MAIAEFALSVVSGLVANGLGSMGSLADLPFFRKRRVERRIEDATAEVVEPLIPFLQQEGVGERKQKLLFDVIVRELKPISMDSELLFAGSLNGQKVFENLYKGRELPPEITDERLESIYSILCPRIATLLCLIPQAVQDWEANAWAENYRRLDQVSAELKELFRSLDNAARLPSKESDSTLLLTRRTLAQQIGLSLDLTGLRADKPIEGKLDDFFVYPEIVESKSHPKVLALGTPDKTIQQMILKKNLAIVIGQPGAGKSTWAKWLQRESLRSKWPGISVRLELRYLDSSDLPSIQDLVRNSVSVHLSEEMTAGRVKGWMSRGLVIFIFDGLDEVAPQFRTEVVAWIEGVRSFADSCTMVITSRPLTTDHVDCLVAGSWVQWEIQPFDDRRVFDYISRWYEKVPLLMGIGDRVSPKEVASQLSSDPTIAPLTANPLLLSTLLMVHHLDGTLPSGRSELYRRYVDGMLGLWDARRKVSVVDSGFSPRGRRQVLTDLALYLHVREEEQIDEVEAVKSVSDSLGVLNRSADPLELLSELRERSGLLVGPGTYSFVHKSVAEYLVAEAVVQGARRDPRGERIDRFYLFAQRGNDRWRVVLFLWAGLVPLADMLYFVDECLKVGDLSLAYGLVTDQFDRVPAEYHRKMVKALRASGSVFEKGHYSYMVPVENGYSGTAVEIATFKLVGISGSVNIFHYVRRLAADGLIELGEFKLMRGSCRTLFWLGIIVSSSDLEVWEYCLKRLPAHLKDGFDLSMFVADHISWRLKWGFYSVEDCVRFAEIFASRFPGRSGDLVLGALMNLTALWAVENIERDEFLGPERDEFIVEFLLAVRVGAVFDKEVLKRTQDWVVDFGQRPADLISRAEKALGEYALKMQGENDGVQDVYELIRELRDKREMLQSASPDLSASRTTAAP